MLNLDTFVGDYSDLKLYNFNEKYTDSTINTLINFISKQTQYIGIRYTDIYQLKQYCLPIIYLNDTINFIFEFDETKSFIFIVYYNKDEVHLKIQLRLADTPTILLISDDKLKRNIKNGVYLMQFAHKLLKLIGCTKVRLDDDSYLINNGHKTKLWLYSLLKYNRSWYAKFGYEPNSQSDIDFLIKKIKSIKNETIIESLNKVEMNEYNDNINKKLSPYLNCVFGEFVEKADLESFTIVTNSMMQSIFNKQDWFKLLNDLFVANVIQVNNNL